MVTFRMVIRAILGVSLAISVFVFASAPAFAVSSKPKPIPTKSDSLAVISVQASALATPNVTVPAAETDTCLYTAVSGTVTGPNRFIVSSQTYNGCGISFAATTRLTVYNNCNGSNLTRYQTVTLGPGQTADIGWGLFSAGCVLCTDGVPTDYPPFTVNLATYAYGTINKQVNANSNYGSATVPLTNTPPTVFPPCP